MADGDHGEDMSELPPGRPPLAESGPGQQGQGPEQGLSVLSPLVSNVGWVALESREKLLRVLADLWEPDPAGPAAAFLGLCAVGRGSGFSSLALERPPTRLPVLLVGDSDERQHHFLHWYTGGLIPELAAAAPALPGLPRASWPMPAALDKGQVQVVASGPREASAEGEEARERLGPSSPAQALPLALGRRFSLRVSVSKERSFPCIDFFCLSSALLREAMPWEGMQGQGQQQQQHPLGVAVLGPGAAAEEEKTGAGMSPAGAAALTLGESCDVILAFLDASSPSRPPLPLTSFLSALSATALSRVRFVLCPAMPVLASGRLTEEPGVELERAASRLASSLRTLCQGLSSLQPSDILTIPPSPSSPLGLPLPNPPSLKGAGGNEHHWPLQAALSPVPANPFPPLASLSSSSLSAGAGPALPFPLPPPACLPASPAPQTPQPEGLKKLEFLLENAVDELVQRQVTNLRTTCTAVKDHVQRKLQEAQNERQLSDTWQAGGETWRQLSGSLMTVWVALAFPLLMPLASILLKAPEATHMELGLENSAAHLGFLLSSSPFYSAAPSTLPPLLLGLPLLAVACIFRAVQLGHRSMRHSQRVENRQKEERLAYFHDFCGDVLLFLNSIR